MIPIQDRRVRAGLPSAGRSAMAFALLCGMVFMPSAWCSKKSSKTLTGANGAPFRKVYIRSASPDLTNSAAIQVNQDTCLTIVSSPKQADAVLEVGIVLPGIGGGAPSSGGFGSDTHEQTKGGGKTSSQYSASCSDDKGSKGCTSSGTETGRGGLEQPPDEWPGTAGAPMDVSLTLPGNSSDQLWEPNERAKKSWSDQLRHAAGCPVCPGEHFNRRKYATYRSWIQAKCPAVLAAP